MLKKEENQVCDGKNLQLKKIIAHEAVYEKQQARALKLNLLSLNAFIERKKKTERPEASEQRKT